MTLYYQFQNKHSSIPRDRIYSLLSLYICGDKIDVDYAQPDDELICNILRGCEEAIGVCSVVNLISGLSPQSNPIGTGYMEVDVQGLWFAWGPTQTCSIQHSTFPGSQSYVHRRLKTLSPPLLGINNTGCLPWRKLLDVLKDSVTLIEHRVDMYVPELQDLGQEVMANFPSELQSSAGLSKILRRSGEIDGPSTLRMYAKGFSIREKNQSEDIWTIRISLGLVWDILSMTQRETTCKDAHKPSRNGACQIVKLGCGPWNLRSESVTPSSSSLT